MSVLDTFLNVTFKNKKLVFLHECLHANKLDKDVGHEQLTGKLPNLP